MPQKVIRFKGINRKVNEFQTSGECEELINLRPDINGGLHIVKQKFATIPNVQYVSVYEHSFGDTVNMIGVTASGHIDWIGHRTITTNFLSGDIELCSAGNVLIAYNKETKTQYAFRFKNEDYETYNVKFPRITAVVIDYNDSVLTPSFSVMPEGDTVVEYQEALNNAASGFYTEHPNCLCGAAVVGCTYEMEDGSELWSTGFVVANATQSDKFIEPAATREDDIDKVKVYGVGQVRVQVHTEKTTSSTIKKINVYASRPVYQYKVKDVHPPITSLNPHTTITTEKLSLEELHLADQVMYYQGSLEIGEDTSIILNFGPNQAGEKIMDVTSGCITRRGEITSYNNRFHYYNSKVNHAIQLITTSHNVQVEDTDSHWIGYVNFDGKWRLLNYAYTFNEAKPQDFIYPLSGIKEIAFVKGSWDTGDFEVPYEEMFYVKLKDSSAYNYSYAFDTTPKIVSATAFYDSLEVDQRWGSPYTYDILLREEENAMNVSAPFNPYVFPVEYSYSFGGKICDVVASYIPISSTQVGQYPLNVFTSNGIFALEQGNGSTLYSNITPLQPMAIDGKATSTPVGTFFSSSKSLYLLSGREAANLSYILNGERELTLRDNEAFNKLCCNNRGVFYNYSPILSSKDFEEYIADASLVYDQLNNELYISSNDDSINYSYVFNIDSKTYHKVAKKYRRAANGSRYALEVVGGDSNVVDLHTESDYDMQPILLQSRPMPLEVLYTHIQRMILLIDTKLSGNQNLCLSVFGSDNLYDWKCIISAQKHDTTLRQIRTNRAAKSYKDYIVLVSGMLDTRSNISDLIVDYTAVNRRLG